MNKKDTDCTPIEPEMVERVHLCMPKEKDLSSAAFLAKRPMIKVKV